MNTKIWGDFQICISLPLNDIVRIETNQLICNVNQLFGFYNMETFIINSFMTEVPIM